MEHQNIMQSIEENTERLDLLQKSLAVEQKQKQRLFELSNNKKKELEEANRKRLYEVNCATTSILDQEDSHRKELVENMVQNSATSLTPVVKVMTNVQGTYFLYRI